MILFEAIKLKGRPEKYLSYMRRKWEITFNCIITLELTPLNNFIVFSSFKFLSFVEVPYKMNSLSPQTTCKNMEQKAKKMLLF